MRHRLVTVLITISLLGSPRAARADVEPYVVFGCLAAVIGGATLAFLQLHSGAHRTRDFTKALENRGYGHHEISALLPLLRRLNRNVPQQLTPLFQLIAEIEGFENLHTILSWHIELFERAQGNFLPAEWFDTLGMPAEAKMAKDLQNRGWKFHAWRKEYQGGVHEAPQSVVSRKQFSVPLSPRGVFFLMDLMSMLRQAWIYEMAQVHELKIEDWITENVCGRECTPDLAETGRDFLGPENVVIAGGANASLTLLINRGDGSQLVAAYEDYVRQLQNQHNRTALRNRAIQYLQAQQSHLRPLEAYRALLRTHPEFRSPLLDAQISELETGEGTNFADQVNLRLLRELGFENETVPPRALLRLRHTSIEDIIR